ncbi:MAG TPA: acyltransferase [Chitinophaga sp.]|uniref:acyltransferase family protein n=1 Tax=Chitinophaga sp. TaxID=1869181 RepID=UPI002DBABCF9|nr:acyltransferase [Chitinophaga sp.]HEU4553672.1 acyltransferase [Chitinophaga sp.]
MELSNRITGTPSKKLAGLDHLRALAIALVFICHYRMFGHPDWANAAGSFGWTGVDLFFVLSGYLIAAQLFKRLQQGRGISLREFYIKRFFRILPAYLVVLTVYFTVPAFKEFEGLAPLWKFLTFTQNFRLDLGTSRAFSHAWSLCIEEQFYLLLPLTLLLITRWNVPRTLAWGLGALFIAGFVIRMWGWAHFIAPVEGQDGYGLLWFKWIYYPTYNRLDGLLTGIAIAAVFEYYPALRHKLTKHGNAMLLLGLALFACAYLLCNKAMFTWNTTVIGFPLISIAFGVVVIAALSPSCILYRVPARVTGVIATLSYSIYLSHKGVVHLTQQWLSPWLEPKGMAMFLVCTGMAVLAAALLRWVVEKPFLRWRDKVLSKGEAAPVVHLKENAGAVTL